MNRMSNNAGIDLAAALWLAHDEALALFAYDRDTGVITWRKSKGRSRAGSLAGHRASSGYITIRINGKLIYGHRLAVFLETGVWPDEVDHADGDRNNNRWSNLRPCSKTENRRNVPTRSTNTSGYKGVSPGRNGKWRATITCNKKHLYLGEFASIEEAAQAYDDKARELHGTFARTNDNA